MASLASYFPPALDALAARLAGWTIGRRRLTAVLAIFPGEALPHGLQSQDPRQLFAQGLDFRTQRGVFGFQVGNAFCSRHAPILPAYAIPT